VKANMLALPSRRDLRCPHEAKTDWEVVYRARVKMNPKTRRVDGVLHRWHERTEVTNVVTMTETPAFLRRQAD
jgi:hypothetical protein